MPTIKALNEYVGALMLTAIVAVVGSGIMSRESIARLDERVGNLERMQEQQVILNDSVAKLSQSVAILQDRGQREELLKK